MNREELHAAILNHSTVQGQRLLDINDLTDLRIYLPFPQEAFPFPVYRCYRTHLRQSGRASGVWQVVSAELEAQSAIEPEGGLNPESMPG